MPRGAVAHILDDAYSFRQYDSLRDLHVHFHGALTDVLPIRREHASGRLFRDPQPIGLASLGMAIPLLCKMHSPPTNKM